MSEAMMATQYQASQIQKIPNYYIKWIWPNFRFALTVKKIRATSKNSQESAFI